MSDSPELPNWYNTQLDPYLLEVGRVSAIWAATEYAMDVLIWFLMGVHPRIGACVTAQMIGPGPRTKCLLALAKQRFVDVETIGDLHQLTKNIRSIGAKRNRYSHDTIHFGLKTKNISARQITADGELKFGAKVISLTESRKFWEEIRAVNLKLYRIHNKIIKMPLSPLLAPLASEWTNSHPPDQGQDSSS